ncbi:MAG TPA: hypothetical protein VN516_09020 [Candidatus Baltobacteraceae bacterium]|nr:hypothetical protein [Candidatus Baltobacteraceae bacterium]
MTPHNEMPDFEERRRKLPPEFKFLAEIPDFSEMDADEIHAWSENYFAKIRSQSASLKEHGLDAEELIAGFEANLHKFEKEQRILDRTLEKYYQSEADVGEANYKLFKHMDYMLKKMLETKPFDPFVEEWKEFMDEWRKHMPKE